MKKIIVLAACIICNFFIAGTLLAQDKKNTPDSKGHFEIEVDPLAYGFKGYSLHAAYQLNRFRYDAFVFGIETPDFLTSNDDFKERSNGFGFKVDYIGKNPGGWFVGLETDYSFTKATLKENGQSHKGQTLAIGIRGGYRFLFGKASNGYKGFYIAPWVGLDGLIHTKDIQFEQKQYKQEGFRIFPTLHLGWRF